jgi:hypothetical protein
VALSFVHANPGAWLEPKERQPGTTNYLYGPDPSQWRSGIHNYSRVVAHSVYPGIDLVYYGNQRELEYDLLMAPGSDPEQIRLRFDEATQIRLERNGDVVLITGAGEIRQRKPIVYQGAGNGRRAIDGRYVRRGKTKSVSRWPATIPPSRWSSIPSLSTQRSWGERRPDWQRHRSR